MRVSLMISPRRLKTSSGPSRGPIWFSSRRIALARSLCNDQTSGTPRTADGLAEKERDLLPVLVVELGASLLPVPGFKGSPGRATGEHNNGRL